MTKEEAIDILQEDIAINKHLIDTLPSTAAETFKNDILAYNMAIQSLEAWEKVKNEIKQKSDYTKNIWDEYPDEWYAGKCSVYHESLEIIDKYLAEVSE